LDSLEDLFLSDGTLEAKIGAVGGREGRKNGMQGSHIAHQFPHTAPNSELDTPAYIYKIAPHLLCGFGRGELCH